MSIFKRVAVGLSGGVDSAVAALILKNMGFDVVGVFMRNWDLVDESGYCNQDEDLKFVKEVCEHINIECHEVNFVKEYWNSVFVDLLEDYEGGLTPNPDILCNKFIKFDSFLKYSCTNLGADAIATGHYANNSFGKYLGKYTLELPAKLLTARDSRKDQTFFLSQMPQEALRRTMFPLGDMLKKGVKTLATENGFSKIANRKESMGICFIGSRNFKNFMREYVKPTIGKFIDIDTGGIVGEHQGKHTWTVGQRCRIGGKSDAYYIALKSTGQDIFVCKGHNHPALFSDTFLVSNPFWIAGEPSKLLSENVFNCSFRFQHGKPLTQCSVFKIEPSNLWIRLAQPLRALTPGQYAVFYKDDECLGSARIVKPVTSKFIINKLSDVLWQMVFRIPFKMKVSIYLKVIMLYIIFSVWATLTVGILVIMEGLSAFLHALRLHWMEFQSKFFGAGGYCFQPFTFNAITNEVDDLVNSV